MRCISALVTAAVMVCAAVICQASMIIADNVESITKRADLIVRATCLSAKAGFAGKRIPGAAKVAGMEPRIKAVKHYDFRIEEVLVNRTSKKWHAGNKFTFSQFQGFTLSTGKVVHPSVRLPSFIGGTEYIVFFAVKGDRIYTIGVNQGVFQVKDDAVSNPYMKLTMFKGVSTAAPGMAKALQAARVDVSAPPTAMALKDFSTMVKDIAAAQGGAK